MQPDPADPWLFPVVLHHSGYFSATIVRFRFVYLVYGSPDQKWKTDTMHILISRNDTIFLFGGCRYGKTKLLDKRSIQKMEACRALAEDQTEVLKNVFAKIAAMDKTKLKQSVAKYGDVKTKNIFAPLMQPHTL
jgi:hypothetical protein